MLVSEYLRMHDLQKFAPCRPHRQNTARGRGAWALVSLAGVAIACTVAITFPFFSTVTAVIAALGDLAGAYALPALFVLVRAAAPRAVSRLCMRLARTKPCLQPVPWSPQGTTSARVQAIVEWRSMHA